MVQGFAVCSTGLQGCVSALWDYMFMQRESVGMQLQTYRVLRGAVIFESSFSCVCPVHSCWVEMHLAIHGFHIYTPEQTLEEVLGLPKRT